jgi:hypothetical protein
MSKETLAQREQRDDLAQAQQLQTHCQSQSDQDQTTHRDYKIFRLVELTDSVTSS